MFKVTKSFLENKFARNVALVATGAAGAQLISIACAPLVARLYGPEAFGLLGSFTALLLILAPLGALSYPIAIVLPKHDRDAFGLAWLSLLLALSSVIFFTILIALCGKTVLSILNLEALGDFIWLLPFAMLFSVAAAIGNQWVIRKKLFHLKAKVAILQSAFINLTKLGIGFFNPIASVLICITTLGGALHASMLYMGIRKQKKSSEGDGLVELGLLNLDGYRQLAWRHRDFAFYRTPQIFLNSTSQGLPVLILVAFFGPVSAGFYSLCRVVLSVPSTLIGQSMASVFYPRFNEAVLSNENSYKLLLKSTLSMAAIGVIPFGLIIFFGPWLFTAIFGEDWLEAGIYAQWLALWSFFAFLNRPSVAAIPVLGLQGYFLIYEVVSVALRVFALYIGFMFYENATTAIALFSAVGVVLNIWLILRTLKATRVNLENE